MKICGNRFFIYVLWYQLFSSIGIRGIISKKRFKRGDESRNTEGSGLGLAIAKDLVKLMNGIFEITVDGDLFKATVMLEKAEENQQKKTE